MLKGKSLAFWSVVVVVGVCFIGGAVLLNTKLRGILNKNPGNIRDNGTAWQGKIGTDSKGFVIFDTSVNGLRALGLNAIHNYRALLTNGQAQTLENFGEMWAPASDNPGSAVGDYGRSLASTMGIPSDQPFDISEQLGALVPAIVKNENGTGIFYTSNTYAQAVSAAKSYAGIA